MIDADTSMHQNDGNGSALTHTQTPSIVNVNITERYSYVDHTISRLFSDEPQRTRPAYASIHAYTFTHTRVWYISMEYPIDIYVKTSTRSMLTAQQSRYVACARRVNTLSRSHRTQPSTQIDSSPFYCFSIFIISFYVSFASFVDVWEKAHQPQPATYISFVSYFIRFDRFGSSLRRLRFAISILVLCWQNVENELSR